MNMREKYYTIAFALVASTSLRVAFSDLSADHMITTINSQLALYAAFYIYERFVS